MSELKKLESELKTIDADLEKVLRERDGIVCRKAEIEERLKSFDHRMEALRTKRQNLLALGQGVEEINREIRALKDQNEEDQDALIGLSKRLSDLDEEKDFLRKQKINLFQEICREKARLLIPEYNTQAEKLAEILRKIWDLLVQAGDQPDRDNPAIKASSWGEAFSCIPRLYHPKEFIWGKEEDFFRGRPKR